MKDLSERIFIGVAWPYANGSLHLGHIAGCYLAADIFAKYHRMVGNEVLMVSGSDQHGTPITIRAEQESVSPQQVVDKYHSEFLNSWSRMGIDFDLFTNTTTENHKNVVQELFLKLLNKGHIYEDTMKLPYCPKCERFRPDRYIEGICNYCKYDGARGDQCENCGKTSNPEEMLEPKCRVCRSSPQFQESNHFFLRLSGFQKPLLEWVKKQKHWRPNVLNFTLRYIQDGLKDRAITRDINWGIPIPLEGYSSKRIYVWFEAVTGYLSAAIEWATLQNKPKAWEPFYKDEQTKAYHFLGKDNIPFHTIIWPSMLMGEGSMILPYDVPANEFLNLEDSKISTSRNWAVWLPDYLSRYDPDPLRYVLSATMPETSDSHFSWNDYIRRNNQELVANYGNMVHRTLTLTHRIFNGSFPIPGSLDASDQKILESIPKVVKNTGTHIAKCNFRQALHSIMSFVQEGNRYIDLKAPWKTMKSDIERTATTLWICLSMISCLRTISYPFLPFSAQKLHEMLGDTGSVKDLGWVIQEIIPNKSFPQPKPLFSKLDDSIADEELERLDSKSNEVKPIANN